MKKSLFDSLYEKERSKKYILGLLTTLTPENLSIDSEIIFNFDKIPEVSRSAIVAALQLAVDDADNAIANA